MTDRPDLRVIGGEYGSGRMDPQAVLERALAPDVVAAISMLIDQRAEDVADRRLAQAQFAGGKPWLTVAEAAELLGCTPVAVRHRVRRGRLEGRYQGRRLYVAAQSILALSDYSADTGTTTKVAPARRTPPGARPRRKEILP